MARLLNIPKIALFGLIGLLAGLLLTACESKGPEPAPTSLPGSIENGEIKVWAWGAGSKGLQANLAGFRQVYPNIKVNLLNVEPAELYDKLDAGLRAGGVGLPDIVQVETERLQFFTTKFPEGFADLRSWASKYEGQYDSLPWMVGRRIGRIRAIPWNSEPVGLFYRADLWQQAGIDPKQLETWDDYIVAGQKLRASYPNLKPLALNLDNETLFRVLMSQQEATYFTSDGKINLASPEAVKALTLIKQLYTNGLLLALPDQSEVIAAVRDNRAASYVADPSWAASLRETAPEMAGKWGVLPLPALVQAGERSASLGGSMLAVLRTGKNQEAASAFTEYCLATKENQNLMLRQFGLFPSYFPAYDDLLYSSPQPYFNNEPIWQFFADQVRQLKPVNYTHDFEAAAAAANTAQLLALVKLDPAQALQKKANDLKEQTAREVFKLGLTDNKKRPG